MRNQINGLTVAESSHLTIEECLLEGTLAARSIFHPQDANEAVVLRYLIERSNGVRHKLHQQSDLDRGRVNVVIDGTSAEREHRVPNWRAVKVQELSASSSSSPSSGEKASPLWSAANDSRSRLSRRTSSSCSPVVCFGEKQY
jgi:hypothetical protein